MPKGCCVTFCKTNKVKNPELKFILLPSKLTQPIRRTKWLQAIRREDELGRLWNPTTEHVYVCSLHFATGLKHDDETHPDYIPSLFPDRPTSQSSAASKVKRANRRKKREDVSQPKAATPIGQQTTPVPSLEHQAQPEELALSEAPVPQTTPVPSPEHQAQPEELALSEAPVPLQDDHGAHNLEKQLHEEIYNLRRERDEARKERDELIRQRFSANCVRDDDTACKMMTGLSWTLFESLHQFLVPFFKPRSLSQFKLPTEDQLFVTLVKLRQNPSNSVMCRVLALAKTTYLNMFSRWLDVMYAKLTFLIAWPDRECIRTTIPAQVLLQYPRLTSIIDCFEIRIEHSMNLKTRATTYSNYKSWTTVKYLIACHPAGQITYISKGWGGRTSDVHIVRNSGFLSRNYHYAGDQILADRGFTLKDEFAVLGAELITPSFTRGRKQLSAEDVAHSRLTSNVRIHIERVIGLLKTRYHILDGPLPLRMVKRLTDERQERGEALIDRIVHVCGALVNMSRSIMYTA